MKNEELPENLKVLHHLLKEFTSIHGPPGFEEPVIKKFISKLKPYVDSTDADQRVNVWGVIEGTKKQEAPSLLLAAHLDEVGFIITHITEKGFLRFRKLGGPSERVIQGQRVVILGKRGNIPGVVGVKPGHVTTPEEARCIPPIEEMYIDVGASSKHEVEDMGIKIGAPVTFMDNLTPLGNPYRVASKAIDNRAGLVVLLSVAEKLSDNRPKGTVFLGATVEEEIGLRGAAVLPRNLNPDMIVTIDTTPTDETPDLPPGFLPYSIGEGPIVKISEDHGLVTHVKVRELLIRAAEEAGVPYQLGAATPGVSDATAFQQATTGIPTAMLGIPRRYSHSPIETLDLRDLHWMIELLTKAVSMIDRNFKLSRL